MTAGRTENAGRWRGAAPWTITGRIRKRGSKLEAVIAVPGLPGARRATGCVVGQEEEAEKFLLADLLTELRSASPANSAPTQANGDTTLKSWAESWVAERKGRGVVFVVDEEAHLRHHVYGDLGAFPLRALTKAQMMTWVRTLPDREKLEGDEEALLPLRPPHRRDGKAAPPRGRRHRPHPGEPLRLEEGALPEEAGQERLQAAVRGLPGLGGLDAPPRRAGGPGQARLYALEFLTGMRTGEAAVRRWSDVDLTAEPLARLEVKTAWNSRMRMEKSTKTLVEKVRPHPPELRRLLEWWKAEGFRAYVGRDPAPEDLIVPLGLERTDAPRTPTGSSWAT